MWDAGRACWRGRYDGPGLPASSVSTSIKPASIWPRGNRKGVSSTSLATFLPLVQAALLMGRQQVAARVRGTGGPCLTNHPDDDRSSVDQAKAGDRPVNVEGPFDEYGIGRHDENPESVTSAPIPPWLSSP